jgi:hypothetical protein
VHAGRGKREGEGKATMLKWFDAAHAQDFGRELARFYGDRVPFDPPFNQKQFAAKTQETLKKLDTKIAQFKAKEPLNLYKKAKLGNAFKWELREKGYAVAYVDELTEWLMHRL